MSQSHWRSGDNNLTQNQGNMVGDRPAVRMTPLAREHLGGNAMKDLMGHSDLNHDLEKPEGVYAPAAKARACGQQDGITMNPGQMHQSPQNQQQQQAPQKQQQQQQAPQQQQQQGGRPGAGKANQATYNIFTGEMN